MNGKFYIAKQNGRTLVRIDNFKLVENGFNVILGESGIGKSLIHKTMLGIIDKSQLRVEMDFPRLENTFYVFQEPSSHLNPALSLQRQLNEGSIRSSKRLKTLFKTLFPTTDMQRFLQLKPKLEFPSGGEKQRILILMGFIAYEKYIASKKPSFLLVFDEATSHLDNHSRNVVLELLLELYMEKHATLSFITHDYSLATFLQGRVEAHYSEIVRGDQAVKQLATDGKKIAHDIEMIKPLTLRQNSKAVLNVQSGFRIYGRVFEFQQSNTGCDLLASAGQIVYLKSPSGGGKTTVLSLLLGLKKAEKFHATLAGIQLSEKSSLLDFERRIWGTKAALVFQNADDVFVGEESVFDAFKVVNPTMTRDEASLHLKRLFDTDLILDQKIRNLSGGQKQRVNILRTLLVDVPVLLFDEPLKGMDFASIQRFLKLFQWFMSKGNVIFRKMDERMGQNRNGKFKL